MTGIGVKGQGECQSTASRETESGKDKEPKLCKGGGARSKNITWSVMVEQDIY